MYFSEINIKNNIIFKKKSFCRFLYPPVSKFQVILVAPTSWEVIPKTSIDLDEWEHVISFKNVHLAYEGTRYVLI